MDIRWLKGIAKEDRAAFKDYLLNNDKAFDKLVEILNDLEKVEVRDDYKEAGWPYLRAYDDGYNKALTDVKDLITMKGD